MLKTAIMVLQPFLDLDILIAAETALGHSYINRTEKINCILNLGLDAIECMSTVIHSNPGFEKQLFNCSRVDDIRNLSQRNPTVHANLLKQSCPNCLGLTNLVSVDCKSKVKHS